MGIARAPVAGAAASRGSVVSVAAWRRCLVVAASSSSSSGGVVVARVLGRGASGATHSIVWRDNTGRPPVSGRAAVVSSASSGDVGVGLEAERELAPWGPLENSDSVGKAAVHKEACSVACVVGVSGVCSVAVLVADGARPVGLPQLLQRDDVPIVRERATWLSHASS